jgi:hypothetical protein
LAVLPCRARTDSFALPRRISVHGDKVRIVVPERWSRRQPLTLADLATEQTQLKGFGIRLEVVTE